MKKIEHRGEYLKHKITASGVDLREICQSIGISKTTIWRWLKDKNLPLEKMVKVTNYLGQDISDDFEEVGKMYSRKIMDFDNDIVQKYISVLEENNGLQKENHILREELAKYTVQNRHETEEN